VGEYYRDRGVSTGISGVNPMGISDKDFWEYYFDRIESAPLPYDCARRTRISDSRDMVVFPRKAGDVGCMTYFYNKQKGGGKGYRDEEYAARIF